MDPPVLFVDVPYMQQQRGVLDCGVLLLLSVHLALAGADPEKWKER